MSDNNENDDEKGLSVTVVTTAVKFTAIFKSGLWRNGYCGETMWYNFSNVADIKDPIKWYPYP